MVFWPGLLGQVSFSAMTPSVLVMTRFWRRQVGELRMRRRRVHLLLAELGEGAVDLGEQQEAAQGATLAQTAVALGLLGGGHPGGPLGSVERPPAGGHAAEIGARRSICAAVRGLAGMASARLIWPNWPACETFRPRLPDCGMSSIFIRYLLSFCYFVCCCEMARVAGRAGEVARAKSLPGRDAFHRVPIIAGEVRDAVERVPTGRVACMLLPCALVHAGEAGFEGVDAGGLPLQGGQQFPVVGVQLLQDGQVCGVDALPGGQHLRVEVRPADQLGLGRSWG